MTRERRIPAFAGAAAAAALMLGGGMTAQAQQFTAEDTKVAEAWLDGELDYGNIEITYDGEPIELIYASYLPKTAGLEAVNIRALATLERESKGKIKVTSYFGESLHPQREGHRAARDDIADFTACFTMYDPRTVSMLPSLQLPFLFKNSPVGARTAMELYPEYFKAEMENLGVYLGRLMVTAPYNSIGNVAIRKLEDWNGVKARAGGGPQSEVIKALGGTPINLPSVELYTALQRGTVDVVSINDPAGETFKLHEISKYHSIVATYSTNLEYCISPAFYDGLPDDLKTLVYNWLQRWNMAHSEIFYGLGVTEAREEFAKAGVEEIVPSDAEFDRMEEAVSDITNTFIEKNEAKGLPAKQLVADLRAARDKYAGMGWNDLMRGIIENPVQGMIE